MGRLGDMVVSVPLNPIDDTTNGDIAAVLGGRPVVGCRNFKAGQLNILPISVTGGGGADTLDAVLQESDPPIVHPLNNLFDGTDDGSEKLRDGAASNLEFGIPFNTGTSPGICTIYSVKLQLSRLGTIAAGESIWVSLQADAAGDPGGTPIGGISRKVLGSAVSTSREEVTFFFDVGVDLAASTDYWIVIAGDTTLSAVNCIQVHYDTATSACKYYDAAWAIMTNQNLWYRMEYLVFADTSYSHAQITEGWVNRLETSERVEVNLEGRKDTLRMKYTPSGGTWQVANTLSIGQPSVRPAA